METSSHVTAVRELYNMTIIFLCRTSEIVLGLATYCGLECPFLPLYLFITLTFSFYIALILSIPKADLNHSFFSSSFYLTTL